MQQDGYIRTTLESLKGRFIPESLLECLESAFGWQTCFGQHGALKHIELKCFLVGSQVWLVGGRAPPSGSGAAQPGWCLPVPANRAAQAVCLALCQEQDSVKVSCARGT